MNTFKILIIFCSFTFITACGNSDDERHKINETLVKIESIYQEWDDSYRLIQLSSNRDRITSIIADLQTIERKLNAVSISEHKCMKMTKFYLSRHMDLTIESMYLFFDGKKAKSKGIASVAQDQLSEFKSSLARAKLTCP